jgi:hypothetical protein
MSDWTIAVWASMILAVVEEDGGFAIALRTNIEVGILACLPIGDEL